jgi:cold shock protein
VLLRVEPYGPLRRPNNGCSRTTQAGGRIGDEAAKSRKAATISIISGQIRPLFTLSSMLQPQYSDRPGVRVRGDQCAQRDFIPRRRRMAKGTVKWFNPTKGYGFIQPAAGGKDIFVHISAVQKAGLTTLNEGQTVEYEEIANRGRSSAENLKI